MAKRLITLCFLLLFSQVTMAKNCLDTANSLDLSAVAIQNQLSTIKMIGHFSLRDDTKSFETQLLPYNQVANSINIQRPQVLVMVGRSKRGEDLYLIDCRKSGMKTLLNTPLNRRDTSGGGFSTIGDLDIFLDKQQSEYPLLRVTQTSLPAKPKRSLFSSPEPFMPGPPLSFIYQYDENEDQYIWQK